MDLKVKIETSGRRRPKNEDSQGEVIFCGFKQTIQEHVDHGERIKRLQEQLKSDVNSFVVEAKNSPSIIAGKQNSFPQISDALEQILGFKPPLLHVFSFMYPRCLIDRMKEMTGLKVKRGKFSARETAIIKRNMQDFMQKYEIDDAGGLLGIYTDHKYKNKYRDIVKNEFFQFKLAKDLNDRQLYYVYKRARVIYDPFESAGKFKDEEVERIVRLKNILGNKWIYMSQIVGRSHRHLGTLNWNRGKDVRKGAWMVSEEKQLSKAISKFRKANNLPDDNQKFPWTEISKYIPSRNGNQCYHHWLSVKSGKQQQSQPVKWSKVYSMCLIFFMYSYLVQEENFVDWDAVFQAFQYIIPYLKLKVHWYKLKKLVPQSLTKDHEEIVLYLYHNFLLHYLPRLNIKISDLEHWLKTGEFPLGCKS